MEEKRLSRRDFIKWAGAAGAVMYGLGGAGCKSGFMRGQVSTGRKLKKHSLKPGIGAARGGDAAKLAVAAVAAIGGMKAVVSRGDTVVIKPNMAWDRTPEQAANTNPLVVAAVVKMCLDAGAAKVKVFDRPCNEARRTYRHSGIAKAAEAAGAAVEFVDERRFAPVRIEKGKLLRAWDFYEDALKADVFINIPIVKHHGSTRVTMGLKNIMGCAGGNRGLWHIGDLHQRIADANSAVRPDLVVLDAFRMLMAHGPQGGGTADVKNAHVVAASTDIVAIDAWGARLFGVKPEDVAHIRIAAEMGLGEMNLRNVRIHEKSV